MQWFVGLAEGSLGFKQYANMAKVAIHTALKHTSLQPHVLYHGGENDFTRWLDERKIPVIHCKSYLASDIAELRCGEREENIRLALRGIFLRVELPGLSERLNLDNRVLYTDCDVFFCGEVANEFTGIDCKYFAVAGEFDREDHRNMNTGVMWMNLPALRKVDAEFRNYLRENLGSLQSVAWDQGAYRQFFTTNNDSYLWDNLRPELNWKPYWGDCSNAKIIHFHGPKPFQRLYIDSHYSELKHLTGGSYEELCARWGDLFAEANK